MSEKMFWLDIVTPKELVFSGEVSSLYLPGVEGELGVLKDHCPLLAMLEPGILRYTSESGLTRLATANGFVQVIDNKVSVVVELAKGRNELQGKVETVVADYCSGLGEHDSNLLKSAIETIAAEEP